IWEILLLASLAGTTAILIRLTRTPALRDADVRAAATDAEWRSIVFLLVICILVYSAAIIYAGARSVIVFGPRLFLPILPLYVLLLGMGASWVDWRLPTSSTARWLVGTLSMGALIGYAGVNARDLSLAV